MRDGAGAEGKARVALPVVLIGPVNAGKSMVGALLAERLGVPSASLDDLCWEYFAEMDYDESIAREHFLRGGQAGALEYVSGFYPAAVERIVAEHPHSVIELGAGHTVHDNPERLAHVKAALSPCRNVVLLLPSSDPDESIRILSERESNPHPEIMAMNERFVRHSSNRELATITVFTKGKTPEETCDEVLSLLS